MILTCVFALYITVAKNICMYNNILAVVVYSNFLMSVVGRVVQLIPSVLCSSS